jgi:hypothetical protein
VFDGFLLLVRFKILRVEHLLRQRLKRVRNVVVSVLSDVVHREVEDNWNTPSSISNFADSGTPARRAPSDRSPPRSPRRVSPPRPSSSTTPQRSAV